MSYRLIINGSCSASSLIPTAKGILHDYATKFSQHGGSGTSSSSSSSLSLPSSPSSRGLILDGEVIGSVSVKSVTPTVNGQRGDRECG